MSSQIGHEILFKPAQNVAAGPSSQVLHYMRFVAPQSNEPGLVAATLGCLLEEERNLSPRPRPSETEPGV